jgi:hypothetical protein
MNRKQFIILLVVVAVIGAAGLLVRQRDSDSWHSGAVAAGEKLLPDLPVNDIAQITIQSGGDTVNLARHEDLWRVQERAGYPANFSQISSLLVKLADLKIVQSDDVGAAQLARFQLLPPGAPADAGTLVEFKDQGGKTVGSLLLGKKHLHKAPAGSPGGGMGDDSWPDGRYVLAGADAKTVAVISDPLDEVEAKPAPWLNKDFLSIEKPRTITAQFPAATNSWKLTRASETNDWELADARPGEKLDASKISSVTSPFSGGSFDDVSAPAEGGAPGDTVLTVETFDGFTYVAKIGPKQNDRYPVNFSISANLPTVRAPAPDEKPADKSKLDAEFQTRQKALADKLAKQNAFSHWTYQSPAYGMDDLLKTRQQLLADAGTNSPAPAQP